MKKILCTMLAFVTLAYSTEAAVAFSTPAEQPATAAAHVAPATKITAKQIEQLTGKKLNGAQKLALKVAQKGMRKKAYADGKSQVVALILVLIVGGLGIHRFYLGYTWQGIVQLLTLGGLGIWALIDLIRIITGDLQPKHEEYTTTL